MMKGCCALFLFIGLSLFMVESAECDSIVVYASGGTLDEDLIFGNPYDNLKLTITMRGDISNISLIKAELDHPYQTDNFTIQDSFFPSFIKSASYHITNASIAFELETNPTVVSDEIKLLVFKPNTYSSLRESKYP